MGRRIGKGRLKNEEVSDDLEEETGFVWDGSHLLQEIHPDGRYTYLYTDPDSYEPLAQVRNWTNEDGESRQQTHYFHCDQIGIPREMTDKDGNLVWFGDYYGWGKLKSETNITGTAHQPFRLQNQYCDRETGLHYNFFRYYEPNLGRFINQDPIKLKGGNNLYQFAFNTQIWIDPKGLVAFAIPVIAPELVALGKATLLLLGLGAAHEEGKAIGTMMAANGNQVDTGVANQVYEKINEYSRTTGKKPDKCDVLQELIDCGQISAKQAKSTQKAWGCRHSRHSKDKCNNRKK